MADPETTIDWPVKRREISNHHMDSTVWNSFRLRDDDIVIASYGKSGTTWVQQIVGQLIFDGKEDVAVSQASLWVDLRIIPPELIAGLHAQTHRRFLKTHLPVDALVFSPKVKYIFVGRDGRDAVWSLHNHHQNANEEYFAAFNNSGAPGVTGLEHGNVGARDFYLNWFSGDGSPYWPFWENVRSWWDIRHLPNVKLVHFNDLKADLAGSIRGIASFLNIKPDDAAFKKVVEHSTFDYMKANANQMAPQGGILWEGGAQTFIHKGTNGRWRDVLSTKDIADYDAKALSELGAECAAWLERGSPANSTSPASPVQLPALAQL